MPFSGTNLCSLDALFPNSKFILTERDSEDWFDSYTFLQKKCLDCIDNLSDLTEQDVKDAEKYEKFQYFHEIKER